MTVDGGIGEAVLNWQNPTQSIFKYCRAYRGTIDDIGAASEIAGPIYGGLGQVQEITDSAAPGDYLWWVVAFDVDNNPSEPAGPISATIS